MTYNTYTEASTDSNNHKRDPVIVSPHSIMEGIILKSNLETDADIAFLSQQLLTIVNKCIPVATDAYERQPKKSNADALNLFISQSRELTNDIRSQHNKKVQLNKILKECLGPVFQKILDQMFLLPSQIPTLSKEDYEQELHTFMTSVAKQVAERLKEIL